jgi:hypothetical protein
MPLIKEGGFGPMIQAAARTEYARMLREGDELALLQESTELDEFDDGQVDDGRELQDVVTHPYHKYLSLSTLSERQEESELALDENDLELGRGLQETPDDELLNDDLHLEDGDLEDVKVDRVPQDEAADGESVTEESTDTASDTTDVDNASTEESTEGEAASEESSETIISTDDQAEGESSDADTSADEDTISDENAEVAAEEASDAGEGEDLVVTREQAVQFCDAAKTIVDCSMRCGASSEEHELFQLTQAIRECELNGFLLTTV